MSSVDAPRADAQDEVETARPRPAWHFGSTTSILGILLAVMAVFAVLETSAFLSAGNLRNIVTDASVLLILSVGMTYVIITGGIDLSVGAVLVFSGVIAARLMHAVGGDGWGTIVVGAAAALAAGLAWGLVNGAIVTRLRVPPLIATLGTLCMAQGLALVILGGIDLTDVPPKLVDTIGTGRLGGVPYLVIIVATVALACGIYLRASRFGRYTYAAGSQLDAARRAGVNIDRHLVKVYALGGLLSGLAGFLNLARFSSTTLGAHDTDNLNAITAVVLGGTSLFGGIGGIAGTVVGVFIPAVLENGLVIVGVQPFWQQIAVGAVLVVAVCLDQLRRRSQYRD